MVTQIHEPEAADSGDGARGGEALAVPIIVFISTDADQRVRAARALDPDGVVIMAPDRETAVRFLTSGYGRTGALPHPLDAADGRGHGDPPGFHDAHDGAAPPDADRDVIVLGELVIDRDRASVSWHGRLLEVTHLEIEVLACLGRTPGRVWSYERLHRAAWHSDYLGDRDSLHSLIKRLRRKLRDADVAIDLHAVRGVGFQLMPLISLPKGDTPV